MVRQEILTTMQRTEEAIQMKRIALSQYCIPEIRFQMEIQKCFFVDMQFISTACPLLIGLHSQKITDVQFNLLLMFFLFCQFTV